MYSGPDCGITLTSTVQEKIRGMQMQQTEAAVRQGGGTDQGASRQLQSY
jgi:hypothetical protein